jgi:uncharacterized protein
VIKQLILPLVGVALFIVLVGTFVKNPAKLGIKPVPTVTPGSNEQEIIVKDKKMKVTAVSSAETRAKGLSGTSSLAEDRGMLFVFDTKDVSPTFWMKDMIIPIDIIWINDGRIVQIDKSIEAPVAGTPDSKLKLYKSKSPIDFVLEVNAGFSDRNGLTVGDEVIVQ